MNHPVLLTITASCWDLFQRARVFYQSFFKQVNPLPRPAMPFGNRKKNILEDLFSSILSKFQKYHPSGNLKFNKSGIFKSLKLRNFMEKSFEFLFS